MKVVVTSIFSFSNNVFKKDHKIQDFVVKGKEYVQLFETYTIYQMLLAWTCKKYC